MKVADVRTILSGYDKTEPEMTRSFAIVRVETDTGIVGFGEASSAYGHAYPRVVDAAITDIVAPSIAGSDPLQIRDRVRDMRLWLDGYLGWEGLTSQVIGATEIALWDIMGKHIGESLSTLLGASRDPITLYGTGTTCFDRDAQWHAEWFDEALAHGFTAVKVRLGNDPDGDIDLVASTRQRIGPNRKLMADGYWTYPPDEAIRLSHRLAEWDVGFFEEPVPQYMLEGLARVREASPVRIAVGERISSPRAFKRVLDMGAADVLQPDPTICGGILAFLDVAAIARAYDVPLIPHVGGHSAIGVAATLHAAAAAGVELFEYDLDHFQPLRDELLVDPIFAIERITDGRMSIPDGPGLGIDIDESVFPRYPYHRGVLYQELYPEHGGGRLPAER